MANSESESSYFIRIRGRVVGPYTVKQLNVLRTRGQFSESNEISADGQTWVSAASLESVFTSAPQKSKSQTSDGVDTYRLAPSEGTASTNQTTAGSGSTSWHYSVDGEQLGPITTAELQEMVAVGRLTSTDLVWKHGMAGWCGVSEIPEFQDIISPNRRSRKRSSSSSRDTVPSDEQLAPHFLDAALAGLRGLIGESTISSMGESSIELGRYAIYVSILLNVILALFSAVKLDSVDLGLLGLAFAALALVCQYAGIKSSSALAQILRSTSLRMSSSAFLDSLVLLMSVGGVVVVAACTVVGIRMHAPLIWISGVVAFLVCELLALMLLHPAAIGITFSKRASSGEDAIAILSFFLMLPIRFVAVAFGLGVALSIIGTVTAFYFLLNASTPLEMLDAVSIGQLSGQQALQSAAFPLVMYVYFVFAFLMIDLIRSVLVIPDKLEQMTQKLAAGHVDVQTDGQNNQPIATEVNS